MITLLHGDDIASSRKEYGSIKNQFSDSITFDGESMTLTDLTQELAGGGLFSDEKYIFIEQLLTKKKSPIEKDAFIELLNKHAEDAMVVLWENKEVDKKTLTAFTNVKNKLFKLPQTLFLLMEALRPRNTVQLLDFFHKTTKTAETELVFFMLIRQIRLLLALSDPNTSIEETKRIAPWQKGKLEKQASFFTKESLIIHHNALFEIEKNMKTGALPMSLESAIDIFLIGV